MERLVDLRIQVAFDTTKWSDRQTFESVPEALRYLADAGLLTADMLYDVAQETLRRRRGRDSPTPSDSAVGEPAQALTAVEWAALRWEADCTEVRIDEGALWLSAGAGEGYDVHNGPARKAIAALALHAQPFGFAWDDVDLLTEHVEAVRFLAARIAALLPPRQTEVSDG